tara:strand:+ start:334 stop:525 length:192 start_codon:yes stop_codon:yes gene_type:complete
VDLLDIKQIQQLLHLHKVMVEVMDFLVHLTMVEEEVVVPVAQEDLYLQILLLAEMVEMVNNQA